MGASLRVRWLMQSSPCCVRAACLGNCHCGLSYQWHRVAGFRINLGADAGVVLSGPGFKGDSLVSEVFKLATASEELKRAPEV